MSLEVGTGRVTGPCIVILSTSAAGGLFESCALQIANEVSIYIFLLFLTEQSRVGVDELNWRVAYFLPYLVDRHTARIVLVISLGEDQLSGNIVTSTTMRTRGSR